MMAAAALVALVVGGVLYWRSLGITTELGEQRNLTLSDGTRVALNTATKIRVRYDNAARRVELERGEALFEVAKVPARPFVVIAGGRRVTAVGTSFVVRRDNEEVAVTLLEGKVTVTIPPGTNSHAKLRIKGRGVKKGDQVGDQYAVVKVIVPKNLNQDEQDIVHNLQTMHPVDARKDVKW